MLNHLPGITGLLLLMAIAPGLVAWWRGRALRSLTDDAALPERLMADRRHNGAIVGATFVLLIAASPDALPWTVPLLVYSSVVAAYPLRKALFNETWSLPVYVWFFTRLLVGIYGFWIALMLMPIVAVFGSFDWRVALVLTILLMVWNMRYADALRFALRARPVEDPALLARFHAMVQVSGIAMPRFEYVDLQGGAVANAIALPSLSRSSVLFTDTLLDRLEADETVAICAHELAHLEHFSPSLLRRLRVVDLLLVASAAAVVPLSAAAGQTFSLLPLVLWLFGLLAALVWRARDRQRNETASDLRAVALCGDSEAVVRGLTRLYTMARVPRRLDVQSETHATHPSLARRIRDIRAAAGTTSPSLSTTASFTGADGRSVITFESDRLQWTEGEAAVHSLSYAYLAELRLDVRGTRPASLIAVERVGRRWELPLTADDVTRVQAVLDIVDARLPAPLPPPAAVVWPKINRVVLVFVAMVGLMVGQLAMAFVTLLAVLQPAAPLVAAAGIASLTAASIFMRQDGFGHDIFLGLALLLAASGIALLIMARSNRNEAMSRRAVMSAMMLGACALLSVAGLALGGFDPVRIHQSARSATAAPVLLLAFAGALTLSRSRIAKFAAIPVIMIAAATSVAASSTFLDRFGRDPFLAPAEALVWRTVTGDPVAEFTVPFIGSGLQLSPGGRQVAILTGDRQVAMLGQGAVQQPQIFHIGRAGAPLRSVIAEDLIFTDDETVLVMRREGDGVELNRLNVDSLDTVVWRVRVADVTGAELSLGPSAVAGRWRVMGWNRRRQLVRAEGTIGEPGVQRTEWPMGNMEQGWIKSIGSSGAEAVLVESRYDLGFLSKCLGRWMFLFQPDMETHFRAAGTGTPGDATVSRLDAQCFSGALDNDQLLCSAFDGARTRFIAVDPASKRVAGLTWMDGRFYTLGSSTGEWLGGWRDGAAVALNPLRRQAIEVAGRDQRAFQVAASNRLVGTLAYNGTGSIVRLYRLD